MSLVSEKEIATAMKISNLGKFGTLLGRITIRLLGISRANQIYQRTQHLHGIHFLDAVLQECSVKYEISDKDLNRLPSSGPFVTISNHPLGAIDGILLLRLMLHRNPDYKIVANFLLSRIEPLKPFLLSVNPFEEHKSKWSSIIGLRAALLHIDSKMPLGIFPAGEVSTIKQGQRVFDRPWDKTTIKMIQKLNVPVIPIYFHAQNSPLFYALAKASPLLRTAMLPSELLSQKKDTVKIRIGNPISIFDQASCNSLKDYSDMLRSKTYMLGKVYDKEFVQYSEPSQRPLPSPISPTKKQSTLTEEIQILHNSNLLQMKAGSYEIYLAQADMIPNLLHEIGRLREICFRQVGEGTNSPIDLDEFDTYYHHLILWDGKTSQIAGAYRIGFGELIYKEHGIEGFYLQKLFSIEKQIHSLFSSALELGRAFVAPNYQKKTLPLFLLWKAIAQIVNQSPHYQYLLGAVSISNDFCTLSKSLIINYLYRFHHDTEKSAFVHPRKAYTWDTSDMDMQHLFVQSENPMEALEELIDEIEPGPLKLPILIKKYIKQNAKTLSYSVDENFNNTIDALMYINVADISMKFVK